MYYFNLKNNCLPASPIILSHWIQIPSVFAYFWHGPHTLELGFPPGIFLCSIITCLCAFAFDSFLGVEDLVGQHIINCKSGKSN